jgi:hypothetical protein
MAQKQLSEMTVEELKAREKTLTLLITFTLASAVLIFAVGILLTVSQKRFSVFTVLPIAFLANVLISRSLIKKIRAEIKLREG